ncbi:hypothetical protein [Streptosporangium sp. NPDC051022]|uniref:hypothetical protein n=1 Tax=Streptosporangium sp. NPDC051022 TaxID=3155752 RepID=UPI00343B1B26
MYPEPPANVTRIRDTDGGSVAVRGEQCDDCDGSLWAWTWTRWRGDVTPERRLWVCWMDLEVIGPFEPIE